MHKTALVLSGGGLFGAYQAGAWRVLERTISPDLVVGASAGSLNGWCIASGASGENLVEHWLSEETAALFRPRLRPRFWHGLLDRKGLEREIRRVTENYRPRVEVGTVVVDFPALRARVLPAEGTTWQHLMASCALPVAYPPVRIGRQWMVDGGLLTVLPLWAAAEMGATRIVAVNVLPRSPIRVLRMFDRLVHWASPEPVSGPPASRAVSHPEVFLIQPATALGPVWQSTVWNRERVEHWIDWGERDAAEMLTTLPASWRESASAAPPNSPHGRDQLRQERNIS